MLNQDSLSDTNRKIPHAQIEIWRKNLSKTSSSPSTFLAYKGWGSETVNWSQVEYRKTKVSWMLIWLQVCVYVHFRGNANGLEPSWMLPHRVLFLLLAGFPIQPLSKHGQGLRWHFLCSQIFGQFGSFQYFSRYSIVGYMILTKEFAPS